MNNLKSTEADPETLNATSKRGNEKTRSGVFDNVVSGKKLTEARFRKVSFGFLALRLLRKSPLKIV